MSRRSPTRPVPGVYPTARGRVELTDDGDGRYTVWVDGVASSPLCPSDPSRLDFEYLQWMAAAAETCFGARTPLRALHLGAGGCALAWHWDVTRPGSRQVAVEIDADLAALVRAWFALPRSPRLRIQVGDAAGVITRRRDASADVVVRDVFEAGVTPAAVASPPFLAHAHRVLAPGGVYLANVASGPGTAVLDAEVAEVAANFPHVAVIAETAMLRGRRFANSVIVASAAPIDGGGLYRRAARVGVAVRVVDASHGTLGGFSTLESRRPHARRQPG